MNYKKIQIIIFFAFIGGYGLIRKYAANPDIYNKYFFFGFFAYAIIMLFLDRKIKKEKKD
uniref:hypothetical protein n=1 Tax=Anaerococcus mediterraneensis TaxID=1870984 RepID=UPI000931446C|nr:hypothetical protein [Anaerococcus mediterraneensis]